MVAEKSSVEHEKSVLLPQHPPRVHFASYAGTHWMQRTGKRPAGQSIRGEPAMMRREARSKKRGSSLSPSSSPHSTGIRGVELANSSHRRRIGAVDYIRRMHEDERRKAKTKEFSEEVLSTSLEKRVCKLTGPCCISPLWSFFYVLRLIVWSFLSLFLVFSASSSSSTPAPCLCYSLSAARLPMLSFSLPGSNRLLRGDESERHP